MLLYELNIPDTWAPAASVADSAVAIVRLNNIQVGV